MKKVLAAMIALSLGACTSKTEYGQCVGAFDDRDPHLVYKMSGWNVAMGILFFEFIVPPIVVVVDETFCPRGRKP